MILSFIPIQITDFWPASKKASLDPLFPDKVRAVNVEDDNIKEKLLILETYFTTQPEWDVSAAGKNLSVAEVLSRWIVTIQEYYVQEQVWVYRIAFCSWDDISR